ncbi:TetR/AcrR family transcriptional regulator [Nocardia pseudovaccinii]|uniref:TetR/AcrR family transcriptional regulator n=1 Tax=Nocardia pseudovaccinii TaxID=189540 RepID=UPI000A07BE49|nr:TetR/AcrR family transcriptional regulator [Nocardia pseudovaccinii]
MTEVTVGRRERKKARTRQAIADAALKLFLERGFDQVTIKDVADAADVSMSGLFKHFPTKESLVFDQEDYVAEGLVAAVRDRPEATPALEALRLWMRAQFDVEPADTHLAAFLDLIAASPTLSDYSRRMWLRQEQQLGDAIRHAGPAVPGADIAARAVARFVLDRTQPCDRTGPRGQLDDAVALLTRGWPAPELRRPPQTRPSAPPSPDRPLGLRERKKAQTRRAITTTALRLFTEDGYDNVGVREIADAAEVSLATVFAYFPDGKASLVFPGNRTDRADALVRAVHHRAPDQTVIRAVHDYMAACGPFKPDLTPDEQRVFDLIRANPEMSDYALRSWTAAQDPLAAAITEEAALPADDLTARLLTRYLLQIPDLARPITDARRTLEVVTNLLERGWPAALTEPDEDMAGVGEA